MSRWIVAGLIVLNVLLGAGLYLHMGGEKTAMAQIGTSQSDYAVVAGYSNQQSYLYLLQLATGRLVAIRIDPVNHEVKAVAAKNVTQDLNRVRN